ncbi:(d)CMP kinase [Verrucomicrobiota bacterium]
MSNTVITIDGPSASGKSTIARCVAEEKKGLIYVDSGSLYRGVAWKALHEQIDADDIDGLTKLLDNLEIEFFINNCAVQFRIDGKELREELRTEAVNEVVSPISAVPVVRSRVVSWLRDMIRFGDLVMEGRDIGTAVFPESKFKFFLDADPAERARRRYTEMAQSEDQASIGKVEESLKRRDMIDSNRDMDPLRVPPGAVVVNSTSMTIDEVVNFIIKNIEMV